jgi:hypothetical protein
MIQSRINIYFLLASRSKTGLIHNIISSTDDILTPPSRNIDGGSKNIDEYIKDITKEFISVDYNSLNFIVTDINISNNILNLNYMCWLHPQYLKKDAQFSLINIQNLLYDKNVQAIIKFI